jgi:hypothetical protein
VSATDGLLIALYAVLGVMSKPAFWYCLTALACANVLGSALRRSARHVAFAAIVFKELTPEEIRRRMGEMDRVAEVEGLPGWENLARFQKIRREMESLDEED